MSNSLWTIISNLSHLIGTILLLTIIYTMNSIIGSFTSELTKMPPTSSALIQLAITHLELPPRESVNIPQSRNMLLNNNLGLTNLSKELHSCLPPNLPLSTLCQALSTPPPHLPTSDLIPTQTLWRRPPLTFNQQTDLQWLKKLSQCLTIL
jgi:hypothetical protein